LPLSLPIYDFPSLPPIEAPTPNPTQYLPNSSIIYINNKQPIIHHFISQMKGKVEEKKKKNHDENEKESEREEEDERNDDKER
jgi:hypothetical protein